MRRLTLFLPLLLLSVPLFAAPQTTRDGAAWRLENAALRVEINAQSGNYGVLDKQANYIWRTPAAGPAPTVLLVPQGAQPVLVDGDLAEWPGKGASLEISPQMLADATTVDGPADCSARVRLLWDPDGLVIAGDVKDERVIWPAAEESRWWEKDAPEFWLDEIQYALRCTPSGANVWSSGGVVSGAKAACRKTPGGYQFELRLPAALLQKVLQQGPGGKFRFAFGINDCDGQGRQCQLYYPLGWVHSNSTTFAEAVLSDASGAAPPQRPDLQPALEPLSTKPGEATFKTSLRSGSRRIPGTVTFRLLGDSPELQIVMDAEDRQVEIGRFSALPPLVLDRPGRIIAATYCDGIGAPTDDLSFRGRNWTTYGSLDMPWVGLTDGKLGYMLLWELPVSCDNGNACIEAVAPLGGGAGADGKPRLLLAPTIMHDPIRKRFAAPRVTRYSFCADGGHVAICKRFREYIKANGLLVTQQEKLRKKPQLANLLGAPDIWGRSDLRFCQEAKAAGIDHLLVNSPQPKADMEKIKAMGYLMGVYDNYEDAFEGDGGRYGDFKTEEDCEKTASGEPVKAWLTKGEKPKQFMKRCALLFEEKARKWIPPDLAIYPYNARFIDVTTATGLRECYHERHPYDRTAHRESNRKLARYVGDELCLVLGGEHGRWWGADIYNYWEGMQSGGNYSWPAGHVGLELPKTREEIGQKYLEWGMGAPNRYPLWELVYHDCVVSTWYWGDSSGHLNYCAPEIGHKQDAFNILYGTVPLYWVAQPYSYNWSKPELRERLLESYRITCKLHEKIGFQEMRSHEFVTPDRQVQHTVFADGTNCWVNFGAQPWTLRQGAASYVLPEFGFYVTGPQIRQYRIVKNDHPVTVVQTGSYLFASESVPGVLEFTGPPPTCRAEDSGRIMLSLKPETTLVKLNPASLGAGAAKGQWRVLRLDAEGEAQKLDELVALDGAMLTIKPAGRTTILLLGPQALASHGELMWSGAATVTPAEPKQGQAVTLSGQLCNVGGKLARTAVTGSLLQGSKQVEIGKQTVELAPGAAKAVSFRLDTAKLDGQLTLRLVAEPAPAEIARQDNTLALAVAVTPDWSLWDGSFVVKVRAQTDSRRPLARCPLDLAAERAKLNLPGAADPASVRVVLVDGQKRVLCPSQLLPAASGTELVWELPVDLKAGAEATCRVYFDRATPARHQSVAAGRWDAARETFVGPTYSVKFAEGYIRRVDVGPERQPIIGNLGTSSKDTGWNDEKGTVESFEIVADGPVVTVVRAKKKLEGNHAYDKLYSLYSGHFTVTLLSKEIYGIMSRSFYLADGNYADDKGNQAVIDGKGDGENIYSKNPKPKWYATWGPTWAINCLALTPHDNVGYWDAGSKAGVGFHGGSGTPTVAYAVHLLSAGDSATAHAAQDYEQLTKGLVVER